MSFAFFTYKNVEDLEEGKPDLTYQVGFDAGNGIDAHNIIGHSNSDIYTENLNGMNIFRIDGKCVQSHVYIIIVPIYCILNTNNISGTENLL